MNKTIHFQDYQSNFRDLLNQFRKEKKLTDVELQVGDKLFPAHRTVLSLYSPVLEAMISEQWLTTKICSISEEYVDSEIVEDLLNFLYTGSIHLTPDNVYPVCMAAHFLQIKSLFEASVKHLCKQITVQNVLQLYGFSTSRNLDVLQKSCFEFILINSEEVFQEPQILQFSSQDFTDLIIEFKNQCWGPKQRDHTFDCVVRWVETNLSERLDQLPFLLENIPLEEVSYRFLTQTVFKHPLVKESFPCIQNLLETFKLSSFEAALNPELSRSKQDLIVISGRDADCSSSVMNYYHAQSQTWRKLPDMLQRRGNFAVTVMNKRDIIVSGGYVNDWKGYSQTTGSVEMFCWDSHTWQKLPNMPATVIGHSMAVHDGHLYVAGGMHDTFKPPRMTEVLKYSFEKRQWKYVMPLTSQHFDGCLVSYKDHLYAINGVCGGSLERYDPADGTRFDTWDQWTAMASMKTTPIWTRATVHQDKIYVSGMNSFEAYDPQADTWTSLPALTTGRSTSLVSLNGKMLLVTGMKKESSVYEFDLSTQQWKKFDEIPLSLIPQYAIVGDDY